MSKKINVLIIGPTTCFSPHSVPDTINLQSVQIPTLSDWYQEQVNTLKRPSSTEKRTNNKHKLSTKYDILIISGALNQTELSMIEPFAQPYRIFIGANVPLSSDILHILETRYFAKILTIDHPQQTFEYLSNTLYTGQSYGYSFYPIDTVLSDTFSGLVEVQGKELLKLSGSFGEEFQHLISWKKSVNIPQDKHLEFWLEYEIDGECDIEFSVFAMKRGGVSHIEKIWHFSKKQLTHPVLITEKTPYSLSMTLSVKGEGTVIVKELHVRESRLNQGYFLPGGQRIVDEYRDEIFYYFHPGDLKPPLNVYFSGYRPLEGFEGYFMMANFGAPFLLISDPRLEGGAFYLGSDALEQEIINAINQSLSHLGFDHTQLILSGLSMGTFGALYYGAQLKPKAIIVGKPLTNLGLIARKGVLDRPNDFGTAFDILTKLTGSNSLSSSYQMDEHFWQKFTAKNLDQTTIAIAHMLHDDFDPNAYEQLLRHLQSSRARIISRGWVGRHNDNSWAIVDWFTSQYQRILKEEFNRDLGKE